MDQFPGHEEPRLELRPPKVAIQRRGSRLPAGTRATRASRLRPAAVGSPGRASHAEAQALHRMDAAIQRDLQEQREGLSERMATLLQEAGGALLLDDLADLLREEPGSEAISGFLAEFGEQQRTPEDLLHALAEFTADQGAMPAVFPVVAILSLQSLAPFEPQRSVDELTDLLDSLSDASADLAEAHGAEAITALPRILSVIHHHARRNQLPTSELPAAIRRITHQVTTSAPVLQRLLRQPPGPGQETLPASPRLQRLRIERPAEITIRYLD